MVPETCTKIAIEYGHRVTSRERVNTAEWQKREPGRCVWREEWGNTQCTRRASKVKCQRRQQTSLRPGESNDGVGLVTERSKILPPSRRRAPLEISLWIPQATRDQGTWDPYA